MEKVTLMNTQIIRRRAFYMERNAGDSIGTDPEMQIRDEDEVNNGYVMYADDIYNFRHPEDRADMFDRMLQGIYADHGNHIESLDAFVEEAEEAVARFREKLEKRG